MSINLQVPRLTDLKPRLTVVGVGGAGGNAVNNMIAAGLSGVQFVVANTDAQALAASSAERRIQLGMNLTEGLGAGSKPEIGQAAAEEAVEEIRSHLEGSHMVFIAAGMGGGTGTGATAVIARVAKELGILTVGIVTKPFQFEGTRRMRLAEQGIAEMRAYVDTLIVIPNQNLFRIANERTTFSEAFVLADQILFSGIACIVDLIVKDGLINLDFADVRTIMSGMGSAMMGTGEASGPNRAVTAAEEAITNPLLDDVSLKGAKGLLLSVIGGRDLTLYEIDEAASRVRQEVDPDANIIVGASFDDTMGDRLRVAIVASGMTRVGAADVAPPRQTPDSLAEMHHALTAGTSAAPPVGGAPFPPFPPANSDAALRPPLPPHSAAGSEAGRPHPVVPMASHGGWPGEPAASGERADGSVTPTRTWVSPDNIIIEERLPGPPHAAGPMMPPPATAAGKAPLPPAGFVPSAPEDIRRPVPRIPGVDAFPPVAQREYRARVGEAGPKVYDSPRPPPEEPRRGSLLQRLIGAGRLGRSSADHISDSSGDDSRLPMPKILSKSKG